jgi:hypothetical protein
VDQPRTLLENRRKQPPAHAVKSVTACTPPRKHQSGSIGAQRDQLPAGRTRRCAGRGVRAHTCLHTTRHAARIHTCIYAYTPHNCTGTCARLASLRRSGTRRTATHDTHCCLVAPDACARTHAPPPPPSTTRTSKHMRPYVSTSRAAVFVAMHAKTCTLCAQCRNQGRCTLTDESGGAACALRQVLLRRSRAPLPQGCRWTHSRAPRVQGGPRPKLHPTTCAARLPLHPAACTA